MGVSPVVNGKDISGTTLALNASLAGADAGQLYYDTTVNQLFVCIGSGTFPANWVAIGGAGNVAAGAAGSVRSVRKILTALVDATFTDVATVTVPNQIGGAGIRVAAVGILGDGDSTSMTQFHGAVSRVAGAATGCTFAAAIGAGTNNGVSGNSAVAIQASGMTGAVGATQTFTVQMKVTKSAGSSASHVLVATLELLNGFDSGITIA